MLIKKIVELKADPKHRLVIFEDEVKFFCPTSVLKERGLLEGAHADPDELKEAAGEGEKKLAEEIAVRKLAHAPRSEKELRKSMSESRIPVEAADATIEKMERYKYLDDERLVRDYIAYHGQKFGRKRLEYELVSVKGIDKDTVREILEELTSDEAELEKAFKAAEKFCSTRVMSSKNPKAKLLNHLGYRGFDAKTAFAVANEIFKHGRQINALSETDSDETDSDEGGGDL
jgi:SOS response regulatory protein OraA/RecX